MRMELGPCDAVSALAWIRYARAVVAQLLTQGRRGTVRLDTETALRLERWLDEWEVAAAAGPELRWVGDIPTDQALALGEVWLSLAEQLAHETAVRGFPLAPPESEPFYWAVVTAYLDALAADAATADAAARLRRRWPAPAPLAGVTPRSGTTPGSDRPS